MARLHDAGIEVMLDVVYNHTAEGNHMGPTLSFRGIDNASYYWLKPDNPRYLRRLHRLRQLGQSHPSARAADGDGFAALLGRGLPCRRLPLRSRHHAGARPERLRPQQRRSSPRSGRTRCWPRVKLVAEPWDLGLGGYQVGAFPSQWSEWNDRYRSAMRRYWSGEGSLIGEVSSRMTGSSDLFNHDGRSPRASVNHVTVHDGFTLADLFSYNEKHNEANGEDNRDGSNDNHSNNCGHEGPDRRSRDHRAAPPAAEKPACLPAAGAGRAADSGRRRGRQHARAATTTPIARTTRSAGSDWERLGSDGDDLTDFVGHMTELRRRFPQIRSQRWLDGRRADGSYGVLWLTPAAEEMKEAGLEFPGRPVSRLCAGAVEPGRRADLHRAERRARRDRVQIAENAGIQELAAGAEHGR